MRLMLIVFFLSFSVFAKDCGETHLVAKKKSEFSKIFGRKLEKKITKEKAKKYLLETLQKNKLNRKKKYALEVLFSHLEFERAKYIYESWLIGEREKTGRWKYLKYIFFNNLKNLSEADLFLELVIKIDSDKRAWSGFNQLIGERNVKSKIDKTIEFLITLNLEVNSHTAAALTLNSYLKKIDQLKKNIDEIDKELLDFLEVSFWRSVTFRSLDSRYDRRRELQNVKDFFVGNFGGFVERLKEMLLFIPRRVKDSFQKPGEYNFISTHLMTEILGSSKSTEILEGLEKIKGKYSKDFLKLVFSSINHQKILKNIEQLESMHPRYLDKKAIFERIDWSQKSIKELFDSRNDDSNDSVETVIRLVENIADYTRFGGDRNAKGTPKQVEEHINAIFKNLSKNTDDSTYGVNQLFKELGLNTDKVNHKYRGAHFTYMFFEDFVKNHRFDQIIGFEIPMRIVKDQGDSSKSYFLFGSVHRGEQIVKMIDFDTGKELERTISFKTIPDNFEQCFSIIQSMLQTVKCSRKKGVFKVIHSRKGDFAYKKNGKYHFIEMKNFGSSLNGLYTKDKEGVEGISREWAFDSFAHFVNKSKYKFKWVINKSSLNGKSFSEKSARMEDYFLRVLPSEARFQKLKRNIKAITPDLDVISKYFIESGIEFFSPHIENEVFITRN